MPGRQYAAACGHRAIEDLGGKFRIDAWPGDVLRIETPGGGGFGRVSFPHPSYSSVMLQQN